MAKHRKTPDMNLPMWFDGQNINEELKKKAQPYLDALEIASERVRAFLDVVFSRGKETQEHKQSVHRRGHDMEH